MPKNGTETVYLPAALRSRIDEIRKSLLMNVRLSRSGLLRVLLRAGVSVFDNGRVPTVLMVRPEDKEVK